MKGMMKKLISVCVGICIISLLVAPAQANSQKKHPRYAPESFVDANGLPFPIDNQYWPLTPGTTFIYETDDGSERNEVYVSHDTRAVAGVTCVVVEDRAWEDDPRGIRGEKSHK